MNKIVKKMVLSRDRMLLSALLKALKRYMNHQEKIKKYINPRSQWSGVQSNDEKIMAQCLRILERRKGS